MRSDIFLTVLFRNTAQYVSYIDICLTLLYMCVSPQILFGGLNHFDSYNKSI